MLSDLVTEGEEQFTISLNTTQGRITFMQPSALVIIGDDNGE